MIRNEKNFQAMLGTISGFSVGATVAFLALFHVYLLATNKSTLEMHSSMEFNVFAMSSSSDNF
jgi:hypothetical protein